jgi:hypothetical protein
MAAIPGAEHGRADGPRLEGRVRAVAEPAVGLAELAERLQPALEVGRLAVDGLEGRDRQANLLELLGVVVEVGDRAVDHRRVGDLELGRRHEPARGRQRVGLAPRGLGESAPLGLARLDDLDAPEDIRHRAADVVEDPQRRAGRAQRRGLAGRGPEAAVLVLERGGVGRRLGEIGRRLPPGE